MNNPESGFEIIDFIIVDDLHDIDSYIKQLQNNQRLECVIVGSGDGTINAVINALKDRDIVFGFLPLGTSNTFVRSLDLPPKLQDVMPILSKQQVRSISLGSVNGTLFANIAGLGIPTSVSSNLTNNLKRWLGPMAYPVSGLREIVRHDPLLCELQLEDHVERFYTHHLLIANGKYHGHLPLSQQVSVHKDNLVVVAFGTSRSRVSYITSMLKFSISRHEDDQNVLVMPFKQARLITRPIRDIEADGEVIDKTPADIRVVRGAIKVLVPPRRLKLPANKPRSTRRRRN